MELLKRSRPIVDDYREVLRVVREEPPQQCILRIDSFSLLKDLISKLDDDYFESSKFSAGGHEWVLRVYPNGNIEEQGSGHLSFYVRMEDDIEPRSFVNATLRFFIFDQIRNNYLTVHVLGDKRFNSMRSIWGVPKILPQGFFIDPMNGFLLDDECVFGAEVLVLDSEIKQSTLSQIRENGDRAYTWKIKKFSELEANEAYSPSFELQGITWKLILFPRGNKTEKGKSLSVYLELADDSLSRGDKMYAEFCLCIKDQLNGAYEKKSDFALFDGIDDDWGFPDFLPLSDLHDQAKGFIVNDMLVVKIKIEVMFVLKADKKQ